MGEAPACRFPTDSQVTGRHKSMYQRTEQTMQSRIAQLRRVLVVVRRLHIAVLAIVSFAKCGTSAAIAGVIVECEASRFQSVAIDCAAYSFSMSLECTDHSAPGKLEVNQLAEDAIPSGGADSGGSEIGGASLALVLPNCRLGRPDSTSRSIIEQLTLVPLAPVFEILRPPCYCACCCRDAR